MTNEPTARNIDRKYCTDKVRLDYAHVGLFDASIGEMWIARKRFGSNPVRVSHARLLLGGTQDTSTGAKDRFVCFWFHTPQSGEGKVHGYPIEWSEGHVLVRLDPYWNYLGRQIIPPAATARIEKNIDLQYEWGNRIFQAYIHQRPDFPVSFHMVGPKASDSMFYIERYEP